MRSAKPSLYVALAGNYFWYFAVIGLMAPFLAVYLNALGFTSVEIGELLAFVMATKSSAHLSGRYFQTKQVSRRPSFDWAHYYRLCFAFRFILAKVIGLLQFALPCTASFGMPSCRN